MKKQQLKLKLAFLMFLSTSVLCAQFPIEYMNVNQLGGQDDEEIFDLACDSQGNAYIILDTESTDLFSNDSIISDGPTECLIKYTSAGEIDYCYKLNTLGDSTSAHFLRIEITGNDEVICSGTLSGTLQFGDTIISCDEARGFMCKFLADGTPGSITLLEFSEHKTFTRDFTIDDENNIYLSGISQDSIYINQDNDTIYAPSGIFKMPIWKFDADFNLEWLMVFYTDGSIVGRHPISLDVDNNIVFAANLEGNELYCGDQSFQFVNGASMLFGKISCSGEIIWIKTAGGSFDTIGYDLCCSEDNNIYFTSRYSSTVTFGDTAIVPTGLGACETFVLALNTNGDLIWFNQVYPQTSWPVYVIPKCIKVNDNGIYLSGEYEYDTYFGEVLLPRVSSDSYRFDSFIAKIDKTTGGFIWAHGLYGENIGYAYRIPFDFGLDNHIIFAAQFTGQATYGNTTLDSYGDKDVFVAWLEEIPMGITETAFPINISIYPNPTNKFVSISIPQGFIGTMLEILDINGRLLYSLELSDTENSIDLSGYTKGLYLFKLMDQGGKLIETKKLIKE